MLEKHFGKEWELNSNLAYYKTFFKKNIAVSNEEVITEETDLCEPITETPEFVV